MQRNCSRSPAGLRYRCFEHEHESALRLTASNGPINCADVRRSRLPSAVTRRGRRPGRSIIGVRRLPGPPRVNHFDVRASLDSFCLYSRAHSVLPWTYLQRARNTSYIATGLVWFASQNSDRWRGKSWFVPHLPNSAKRTSTSPGEVQWLGHRSRQDVRLAGRFWKSSRRISDIICVIKSRYPSKWPTT